MAVEDSVAQSQIRAFVERVERLDEELKAINDDKKEIFAEARGNGFDVPALKQVIKLRRQDANERMEREAIVELYMAALGMIETPDFDEPRVQVQARVREAVHGTTQSASISGVVEVKSNGLSTTPEITPTQDAPHPASDLTASPKLPRGQVAPIQPETATSFADAGAHGAEADDSDSNAVALVPATQDGSANIGGQDEVHARSGSVDFPGRRQSEPAPKEAHSGSEHQRTYPSEINEAPAGRVADESPAPLSFADKIKRLRPNCQHPEACRSSGGKAHCGPCGRAAETGSAA